VVDGFLTPAGTPLARSDELIMQNLGQWISGQEYTEGFTPLIDADFGRAIQVAGRFRRPEIRILAQLLVARAALMEK
jgi:hypothetical protein